MKKTISLNGAWSLSYLDALSGKRLEVYDREGASTVEAIVPGNTDLDLSRAGILPADLMKGMNTMKATFTETCDYPSAREL
ncbi:MAG: hypothetical protein MJ141_09815, partial [Clostridia bacterium]|nr:hypothetical protein [Clostridia bacterium]